MRYVFSEFEMDLMRRQLFSGGRKVSLRPKSFDVLAFLVRSAGKPVERQALLNAVWPDTIASADTLAHSICDIRDALGDVGKQLVLTIPGKGYQLAAPVVVAEEPQKESVRLQHRGNSRFPVILGVLVVLAVIAALMIRKSPTREEVVLLADPPSIAVIPFRNLSGDPEIEPFVAGLSSDVNVALSRVPELLTIAENTAARYRNREIDIAAIAAELGVSHVMTGSVQRDGSSLRIFVEVSSGQDASTVWSRRYDRNLSHFLELQDDIVRNVLVGLQIELTHGDTAGYLSGGTRDIEAWLTNFEALSEGFKFREDSNLRARHLYETAAQLDPNWAEPLAGQAWTYREALRRGWSHDPEGDRKKWLNLAEACAELDPVKHSCFIQLGNYYIENGQVEQGLELREIALKLAPSDLSALSGLAWQLILVGEFSRGLELLQRAKKVSPIHPPWLLATEAYGYQMVGEFDKAVELFREALDRSDFPDWHARLAAVYVELDDMENARLHGRTFVEKSPGRTVSDLTKILTIQDAERTEHYSDLLRRAGVPD